MRAKTVLAVIALLPLLVAACNAPAGRPDGSMPTPSPTAGPMPTKASQPSGPPTPAGAPASDILTLTWWTPEFVSPNAAQPGGPLLAQQIAAFETAHEGRTRVLPILKAKYGKGGLLDYLRTTQPVAPALLPDIVTLDVTELEQAAALGLLQPLDNLLEPELIAGLYPFARQSGQIGGKLIAVQFVADMEHALFNRNDVKSVPETWAGVLAGKVTYLFPAGNPQPLSAASPAEDVQHSFLGQYLSAGATLDPKTRRLTVQEQPLLRVLSFYADARSAGLLPANAAGITSLDEVWTAYTQGSVLLANVSARRYLTARDGMQSTGFAPLPGWSGPATPVTSGWALAIVTAEPVRQKAAAELVTWLMSPERAGAWALAAGWLPVAPGALAAWGANPYYEFLNGQLSVAVAHPIGADYAQTASRLEKAIAAVLAGTSPADATQAAMALPK